jgi:broad specificity phosphatase PhoE
VLVTAAGDRGLAAAASQARSAGVSLAAVLVGPARAYASDLRRVGASVTEVAEASDLTAALEGSVARAQLV